MATGVLRQDTKLGDDSSLVERKRRPHGKSGTAGLNTRKLLRFIVFPFSSKRIYWDLLISASIIYSAIALPVTPAHPCHSQP